MLAFYRRLYPFKSIMNWLNHEHVPTKLYTHREFAFTLQGDVYLRYNSFNTVDDFKKQVCALNPTRFEIGPVYTARPRDKKTIRPGGFIPMQRELVFDIDMTDYDSIRTCCSDAGICKRCWAFIAVAVKVLDSALRDQFGYKHLLWVYSGRRGIHLWISDKEAMELTDDQRRAVVNWIAVITGSKDQHKKVNARPKSRPLPPSLQMALEPLAECFTELILDDQDCFRSEEGCEAFLRLIPDETIVHELRKLWELNPGRSSSQKWDDLKNMIRVLDKGSSRRLAMKAAMEDIILQYTYPRLDAEVSKHRNHLLKAPFCVHPKTGRICVPIDPARIDDFDPEQVPTVRQLLRELDETMAQDSAEGEERHADSERTSLKPYIQMLDKHAMALMDEVRRSKRGADMSW
ncbi:prim-pol domain-containing protein [Gloeophyllum trabeum ATCC 11539]|uniref:DNA primase n=1 Tax=Gloeophyllum trabeum (strain ATCC 11539 / FP-39264 / Madison 617) TaxID=670483 RepID=S7PXK0_GLOTA|nr:prim-pol domain-containing protein [Gloeophyllum trabeum ATCC 11539]EPQ52341.1 prim-pol domain-containing protein [Gloeophyllum trabeum ATCC 11539]